MKFCIKCGEKVSSEKIKFCTKCGYKFSSEISQEIPNTENNIDENTPINKNIIFKIIGSILILTCIGAGFYYLNTTKPEKEIRKNIDASNSADNISDDKITESKENVAKQTLSNSLESENPSMENSTSGENIESKNLSIVDKYSNKFVLEDNGDGKFLLKTPLVHLRNDSFISKLAEVKGIDKSNIIPMFETEKYVYKLNAINNYTGSKNKMKELFENLELEGEKIEFDSELNVILSYYLDTDIFSEYQDEILFLSKTGDYKINSKK